MTMKSLVKSRLSRNVWRAVREPRLHLGSGFQPKRGRINVDLSDKADLQLDLREPPNHRIGSLCMRARKEAWPCERSLSSELGAA